MTAPVTNSTRPIPKFAINAPEYGLLIVLIGVFVWRAFIPAWKSLNTDFVDYYLAARLYKQGYPLTQIYDWSWMQREKDHAGIERPIVAFTSLTPFSMLPVFPLASLPPLTAKRVWLVVSLALLGLSGWLLARISGLGWCRVGILIFLAMVPLRTSFLFGQQTIVLLFLFTLAAYLYLGRRPLTSGLVLALAGALKIWPALYLIYFVRKRQWRAAVGLVVGSIVLWLVSVALFGLQTVKTYLLEVMPWSLRGEGQDPYNLNWNSFSAVLHRLFISEPELNPHPVAHLPALYSALAPMVQGLIFVPFLWLMGSHRMDDDREKLHWGAFLAMLLILSTQAASYDFVTLILTACLATGYLLSAGRLRETGLLVLFYTLVCLPLYRWVSSSASGWHTLGAVPRLWAMTALWLCLIVAVSRSEPVPLKTRLRLREAAVFAGMWLALVAVASVLNLVHFKHEFDNYSGRILEAPDSYLDTDPVVAGNDVLFTMMLNEGYRIGLLKEGSVRRLSFGPDSFHPAIAGESLWVELAATNSQVVRVALTESGLTPGTPSLEADNAEKPSISADGRWLAFVREAKGRGSLWVKDLQSGAGADSNHEGTQISPTDFDVLEAGFSPTGDVIFSARRSGAEPTLFLKSAGQTDIVALPAPAPRRFPAVSPDGRWLAFSQREGSDWQLWVRDIKAGTERSLTHADCNSTSAAWYPDSKRLVYATDCGRSLGLTALCRIDAVP